MKQTVLALISVLIAVVIYADFTYFNDTDHNSSNAETSVIASEPIEQKKKNSYKTPAVTAKSKRLFLEKTTAAVKKVKARLDAEYQMVYELSLKEKLTPKEKARIEKLKKHYKVKDFPCLLKRLHTHPVSIVVAQAALESGWGSSRFYREANNIFGVWSYNPKEPRMAAGVPREGQKTVYVKKYPNLEASIEGYFRMMARGRAYRQFRTARLRTDNPFEMIAYLDHYSELRHEYVKRLYYVIKSNKFYELDSPVYQPPGWSNIEPARAEYRIAQKEEPAAKIADKCKKKADDGIGDIVMSQENNRSSVSDMLLNSNDKTQEKEKSLPEAANPKENNSTVKTALPVDGVKENKKPV